MRKVLVGVVVLLMAGPAMATITLDLEPDLTTIDTTVTPLPVTIACTVTARTDASDSIAAFGFYVVDSSYTGTTHFNLDSSTVNTASFYGAPFADQVVAPGEPLDASSQGAVFPAGHTGSFPLAGAVPCDVLLANLEITVLAGTPDGSYNIDLNVDEPTTALQDGMVITIIPEPATALLLLAGLPFLRRRRA